MANATDVFFARCIETGWALAGADALVLAGVALGLTLLGMAAACNALAPPPDLEPGCEPGLGELLPVRGPGGEAGLCDVPDEFDPLKAPAGLCGFAINIPAALKDFPCCRAPVLFGRRVGAAVPPTQVWHMIAPPETEHLSLPIAFPHAEHTTHSMWKEPREHFIPDPAIAFPQAMHLSPCWSK